MSNKYLSKEDFEKMKKDVLFELKQEFEEWEYEGVEDYPDPTNEYGHGQREVYLDNTDSFLDVADDLAYEAIKKVINRF